MSKLQLIIALSIALVIAVCISSLIISLFAALIKLSIIAILTILIFTYSCSIITVIRAMKK